MSRSETNFGVPAAGTSSMSMRRIVSEGPDSAAQAADGFGDGEARSIDDQVHAFG